MNTDHYVLTSHDIAYGTASRPGGHEVGGIPDLTIPAVADAVLEIRTWLDEHRAPGQPFTLPPDMCPRGDYDERREHDIACTCCYCPTRCIVDVADEIYTSEELENIAIGYLGESALITEDDSWEPVAVFSDYPPEDTAEVLDRSLGMRLDQPCRCSVCTDTTAEHCRCTCYWVLVAGRPVDGPDEYWLAWIASLDRDALARIAAKHQPTTGTPTDQP